MLKGRAVRQQLVSQSGIRGHREEEDMPPPFLFTVLIRDIKERATCGESL